MIFVAPAEMLLTLTGCLTLAPKILIGTINLTPTFGLTHQTVFVARAILSAGACVVTWFVPFAGPS